MLAQFVGQVDINSAAVLIAAFLSFGGIVGALILKHKNKAHYEIQKMRIENERITQAFNDATNRDYKIEQLKQNLITSHKSN